MVVLRRLKEHNQQVRIAHGATCGDFLPGKAEGGHIHLARCRMSCEGPQLHIHQKGKLTPGGLTFPLRSGACVVSERALILSVGRCVHANARLAEFYLPLDRGDVRCRNADAAFPSHQVRSNTYHRVLVGRIRFTILLKLILATTDGEDENAHCRIFVQVGRQIGCSVHVANRVEQVPVSAVR